MANGFNLLIGLGVNDANSRKNINEYIKELRGLEKVKIDLEVADTKKNMDAMTKMQKQILSLQKDLESLGKAMAGGNSSGAIFDDKKISSSNKAIKQTNDEIKSLSGNAKQASAYSNDFLSSLGNAYRKFPVWMVASGTFYGAVNGLKELTEQVIALDTAMTNIQRVSDGSQFEFDGVISRALDDVTALSGKMGDFLELVAEFSRTGKSIDESFDLANTTTMLMNISDLNATQSVNSLTAAMIAFNLEASESARIADKLNEIDNNFAITTLDLSQSMNKAASTAASFGVELNALLGYTVAIGETTRETGNIVGNSLKSIFARITTNTNAISALDAVGISMDKVNGESKNAQELIEEVASRWDTLSDAQRRNLGVNIAGIYQLSR